MNIFRNIPALAVVVVTSGAIVAGAAAASFPAGPRSTVDERADVYQSARGFAYDVGAKRVVGYFLTDAGGCAMSLTIAESGEQVTGASARVEFDLAEKATVAVRSSEGGRVDTTCMAGARAVAVVKVAEGEI